MKKWGAATGRLLATFRGASGDFTDLAVSFDNTLLAARTEDDIVRVWCLHTTEPVTDDSLFYCLTSFVIFNRHALFHRLLYCLVMEVLLQSIFVQPTGVVSATSPQLLTTVASPFGST